MRIVRGILATTTLMLGTGYLMYKFVLNDDAKRGIYNASTTIADSYRQINKVVEDITGIVIEEDTQTLPNRDQTLKQWSKLGY